MRMLFGLLVAVTFAGCGSSSGPTIGGGMFVNDQLNAYFGKNDQELDFVLFLPAKLNREFSEGSSSSKSESSGHERFEGSYRCKDGFVFKYSCSGAAGTMVINQTEYPLAKGRVFVCARDGEKLSVKQLSISLPSGQDHTATIKKLASEQEEIKRFFSTPDTAPSAPGEPKKNP